jgi:hypothetical protein
VLPTDWVSAPADAETGLVTSDPDPNPGGPFVLEVPAFASVHLRVVSSAGEKLATATGFVVLDQHRVPHLITNRHVVTGQNWETAPALARRGRAGSGGKCFWPSAGRCYVRPGPRGRREAEFPLFVECHDDQTDDGSQHGYRLQHGAGVKPLFCPDLCRTGVASFAAIKTGLQVGYLVF